MYLILADIILILHFGVVAFVTLMCVGILVRHYTSWQWIYNYHLRMAHMLCIGVVAIQALSGGVCSLTHAEGYFRVLGGQELYTRSFVQHYLEHLVFIEADMLFLGLLYLAVAGSVAYAWFADQGRLKAVSA